MPECTTLFVPAMAGALTGSYTFNGRFNNGHPVYTDPITGNHIFYESAHFYITQLSAKLFLSLETDAFEPADLDGLQPWARKNDPACKSCVWNIRVACTALTADVAAAATPAPTTAAVVAATMGTTNSSTTEEAVTPTPTPSASSTSSVTETSAIAGCMSLNIRNGAERAGVYVLNTNSADDALLINGRPSYIGVGVNRTADQVFTVMMDVCAAGYGVVDATWAAAVGALTPTATAHAVFLMYAAEHSGGLGLASISGCEVPVWFVTSGGIEDLNVAGKNTFLSLADVEDPSEATSWAKFTPATETSGATLVENSSIDVGCADANEVEEALEGNEEAGTGAGAGAAAEAGAGAEEESEADVPVEPAAVGSEPNGRRLRGNLL